MQNDADLTQYIQRMKAGDQDAMQVVWECYFDRIVRLARRKLEGLPRRVADEEDVALSAFHSFCQRAGAGKFPQLDDRDDLWKLLATITVRKAHALREHQQAQKRGGGQVRGESVFRSPGDDADDYGLHAFLGREPTPQLAAQFAETTERLLQSLGDEQLRRIAMAKLEGYSVEEIGQQLGVTSRTIKRKLALVRQNWNRDAEE